MARDAESPLWESPPETPSGGAAAKKIPLHRVFRAASVACGVQFGWALQLSLLTPYVQELGIPHAYASLVWLCGPISGLVVQPMVGHFSDRLSRRRMPFIVAGAFTIAIGVLTIGYSADIGWIFGDDPTAHTKPRAILVYIVGFWLLDVGNNATQGPTRALLADITEKDPRRKRLAFAYFSFFMALGNILGYATGSYIGWYSVFRFTVTTACSINCANLKSAFLLDIVLLATTTYISVTSVHEGSKLSDDRAIEDGQVPVQSEPFMSELLESFRYFTLPIWMILIVIALTWIGWFPFTLYGTDWMGREIYRGSPEEGLKYHIGVSMGAFGLVLHSILLGITSVFVERLCRSWGSALVWAFSNVLTALCFAAMLVITCVANRTVYPPSGLPPNGIVIASVSVFAILGIPLAIHYSIPYAMAATRVEALGVGQGLTMGILNLAIVIPQMIVSLGSGPLDQLFGGGNSPAFAVAALASLVGGIMAVLWLHRPPTLGSRRRLN